MAQRIKSRQKKTVGQITKTGVTVTECYCRKCMQMKHPKFFYSAVDPSLDANGKFSVCTECINDMFNRFFQIELTMERTILKLCRLLNLQYDENAIVALKKQLETEEQKGKAPSGIFGKYKARLSAVNRTKFGKDGSADDELVFVEPAKAVPAQSLEDVGVEIDIADHWKSFWGIDFNVEDYLYLDQELANWKRTNKCDTHQEITLMREICFIQNDLRKARMADKNTAGLQKNLMDVMKSSALTPASQNAASSGKSADAFGVWIKQIEGSTPAEWWEDNELFKDVDDIGKYIKNYITRPIKNFIDGSRDFTIEEINEMKGKGILEEVK